MNTVRGNVAAGENGLAALVGRAAGGPNTSGPGVMPMPALAGFRHLGTCHNQGSLQKNECSVR